MTLPCFAAKIQNDSTKYGKSQAHVQNDTTTLLVSFCSSKILDQNKSISLYPSDQYDSYYIEFKITVHYSVMFYQILLSWVFDSLILLAKWDYMIEHDSAKWERKMTVFRYLCTRIT